MKPAPSSYCDPSMLLSRLQSVVRACVLLALCSTLGLACTIEPYAEPEPEAQWLALVEANLWQPVHVESPHLVVPDKLPPCDTELGVVAEELNLEQVLSVMTQFCSHVTVEQPLLHALEQGDSLRLRFWHSELTAPSSSEANVALLIGEQLIWSEQFPIPMQGEYLDLQLSAPQDFAQGDAVWFHVDNHGANEYSLIELSSH